jgi:hypothetical protein
MRPFGPLGRAPHPTAALQSSALGISATLALLRRFYRHEPVPLNWGVQGFYGPPYALLQVRLGPARQPTAAPPPAQTARGSVPAHHSEDPMEAASTFSGYGMEHGAALWLRSACTLHECGPAPHGAAAQTHVFERKRKPCVHAAVGAACSTHICTARTHALHHSGSLSRSQCRSSVIGASRRTSRVRAQGSLADMARVPAFENARRVSVK